MEIFLTIGLVEYTPQNATWGLSASSKNPGLSSSGRMAKTSIFQEFSFDLILNPSKLRRTLGPSRTSIRRPEPYSNSCLPTKKLIEFWADDVPTSRKAACK